MKVRTIVAAALVLLASGVASAQEQPPGYGVISPSGSKFTTELRAGDADDYVFDGYAGSKVNVTVAKKKFVTVNYTIELQRPDGTVITEGDGLKLKTNKNKVKASYVLDSTGVWKVRVGAANANGNEYTVTIKYGNPKVPKQKGLQPDGDQQFKLNVPAQAGAQINTTLKFKGNAPTFVSFRDADGLDVAGFGDALTTSKSKVQAKKFIVPDIHPVGDFQLVFDANGATNVSFSVKVKRPKGDKRRTTKLDANEPLLQSLNTPVGGSGTLLIAIVKDAVDSNDPEGVPSFRIGTIDLEEVSAQLLPGTTTVYSVLGRVPSSVLSVPIGTMYDVQVSSSLGQTSVMLDAFEIVAAPTVATIVPDKGSAAGGFTATITGTGFREALNTRVTIDDFIVPVTINAIDPTTLNFNVPKRSPGFVQFGVMDANSQLKDSLPVGSFEYLPTPGINRVTPGLISVLGGEPIFISGAFFTDTDKVFMETTPGSGAFTEVTASQTTFVNDELHSFTAPAGAQTGPYEIFVEDAQGIRSSGQHFVSYFTYTDFTPNTGLNGQSDLWDGASTFVADYDQDGDEDLFISRIGGASRANSSHTRILQNDGNGNLTDVTATVMPATTATDDWRADRVWVADLTEDGFPDLILVTNSNAVPATDKSHVRIFMNLTRPGGTGPEDRIFEDQTATKFAPPRTSTGFSTSGTTLRDNWRGLDMWVGDLDIGAGPPDIIITHDELKQEKDILCGNYCSSPYATTAVYNMYWGGSRAFRWNPNANDGEGQYEFDFTFFPHRQGLVVPIANAPPGVTIPNCNNNTPCEGKFTPFVGQRVTAGFLDADFRTDVAVLSNQTVQAYGSNTASLQILLNRFNNDTFETFTDLTPAVFQLGGDSKGDSLTIGNPGYPDGTGFGFIVTSKFTAAPGATRVMRAYKYKLDGATHSMEDVSSGMLPRSTSNDSWQASAMRFVDVDADGDQDLIVLANQAPALSEPAFRILRNTVENGRTGVMKNQFGPLISALTSNNDGFGGDALSIGDIDGDEALDFYITRAVPVGLDSQTRIIKTEK